MNRNRVARAAFAGLLSSSFALAACAQAGLPGAGEHAADAGDESLPPGVDAGRQPLPDAGSTPRVDAAPGVPQSITLTASSSDEIVQGNSIGCLAADVDVHLSSSYFRVFDLASYGLTGELAIDGVQVGIEVASSGSGAGQPAALRLYTLAGALQMANLTPLASASTTIPDMSLGKHSIAISATVPAGARLAVELYTPDGTADENAVLIGSNGSAEASPTYVMAADCGLAEPVATSGPEIGQPGMHWVLEVNGTYTP